jgi:hypothetical protein
MAKKKEDIQNGENGGEKALTGKRRLEEWAEEKI